MMKKERHSLQWSKAPETWWQHQWHQCQEWGGWLWDQASTEVGISTLVGVLTFALLSFILSYDYLAVETTVDKGISKQTFYAPYTFQVMDMGETENRRYNARLQSDAITHYLPTEPFNQKVEDQLNRLFVDLNRLRKDESQLSLDEKRKQFDQLTILQDNPYKEDIFTYFVANNLSDREWYQIKSSIEFTTLDRILKDGLTDEAYFDKRENIINRAIPGSLSFRQRKIAKSIIWSVLLPNKRVDTETMERLAQQAEEQVEPVIKTYRKGEKIVGKGEPVTPVAQEALKRIGKAVSGINWLACCGVMLMTFFFCTAVWTYLYLFENQRFYKPPFTLLVLTTSTVMLSLFIAVNRLATPEEALKISLYVFPMATFGLTLSIFTHPRIGSFLTVMMTFLMMLTLKVDVYPLAVLMFRSLIGIYVLNRKLNFTDRGQLMWAGLYIALTNMILVLAIYLMSGNFGTPGYWSAMLIDMTWGSIGGLLAAALTIGLMPFLESALGLVSPYTLLELANHDKPLLKRMQFEAPGTFHHSLMVASLSEAAAEAIGGNALLTRVGSLYHDIGKMRRPLFFIENQSYFGVENPHDKMTPRLSKMVITAHTKDSLDMAKQHRLPSALMDFMTEHHGTMVAGYFYNQACAQEGVENVNKAQFRYTGPKPQSRETAIVMLADACESAVRSLKTPTVAQIEERIEKIVQARIDDGQFDNCPITLKDITKIKETFARVLRGIQHNRIEYHQNTINELARKLPEPKPVDLSELQKATQLKVVEGQKAKDDKPTIDQPKTENG